MGQAGFQNSPYKGIVKWHNDQDERRVSRVERSLLVNDSRQKEAKPHGRGAEEVQKSYR